MERFKFGDKVRFHDGVEAVVQGCYEDTLLVAYEECGHDFFNLADLAGKIQKVPHPDTVRLDWLLRDSTPRYISNVRNDEWELLNDVTGLWQEYGSADSAELIGQGATIREAIDAAMQQEVES